MLDYSVDLERVWVCVLRAAEAEKVALLLSIYPTTIAKDGATFKTFSLSLCPKFALL